MNFMAGGIFLCTKFSPGKKHYSAKPPRHFERSEGASRNLLYLKVSYRVETQRLHGVQETIREKFPAEAAGNGFTSDRNIIILIAPVGCNLSTQSLAPRARGPMDAICPSAPQAQVPTGILESITL